MWFNLVPDQRFAQKNTTIWFVTVVVEVVGVEMGKLSKISCFFFVDFFAVVFYIFHYCLLNFVVLFFLNPREIGGGGIGIWWICQVFM